MCLVTLATGCKLQHGVVGNEMLGDGSIDDIDAPPADARVDTPPNSVCFGSGLFVECYDPAALPSNVEQFTGGMYDTSNTTTCTRIVTQTNGPELCLRAAESITINGYVRFKGGRPLVLLATNT